MAIKVILLPDMPPGRTGTGRRRGHPGSPSAAYPSQSGGARLHSQGPAMRSLPASCTLFAISAPAPPALPDTLPRCAPQPPLRRRPACPCRSHDLVAKVQQTGGSWRPSGRWWWVPPKPITPARAFRRGANVVDGAARQIKGQRFALFQCFQHPPVEPDRGRCTPHRKAARCRPP